MSRILAVIGLVLVSPVLAIAWLGVRLESPGPFFYRAARVGHKGKRFVMYKVRTMHVRKQGDKGTAITAGRDARVFSFGAALRSLKIDELPQLINVIRGEMNFVGPRPEDPDIVDACYHGWQLETLNVLPGIASPGSIFNYTHFNNYVRDTHVEEDYMREFLPRKLALDAIYVRDRNFFYDISILYRTLSTIFLIACGRKDFPLPPEAALASQTFDVKF